MDKRYQIFVSSTFTDLKEERKGIIELLLNAKYIPAGMEMFSASNDEQFKYIKKIIDNCDYYILIIGGRYGSINPTTGISFTEQEFDYAISKDIPVLVFMQEKTEELPPDKRETENIEKFKAFKEKALTGRLCKPWNEKSDLIGSVIVSLTEVTSEYPQLGWTRGSIYDNSELLTQINDLRIENDKKNKEIEELLKQLDMGKVKIENLASGKDVYKVYGKTGSAYSGFADYSENLTWDNIFSAIGPYLIQDVTYGTYASDLRTAINSSFGTGFYSINDDCTQTIKIQLEALGLIDVKVSKSTNGGYIEFIGLTKTGRLYLSEIKSIRKG